jgi:signal transduction histidine kinase
MRRLIVLYIIALLCSGVLAATPATQSTNVLIINSYNQGLSWTDSIVAVSSRMMKSYDPDINIFVEYLDTKHHFGTDYKNEFTAFLDKKYAFVHFQMVIVSDNDAYLYVRDHCPKCVKDKPVVFCGINEITQFPPNYTGVIEYVDIEGNIRLIEKIHPDLKKLYVVSDITTTGKILADRVLKDVEKIKPAFEVEILQQYDFQSLKQKVKAIQPTEAMYFLLFNQDTLGHYYSLEEALDSVSAVCKAPIYGSWSFYLQHGLFGGIMQAGSMQGRMTGQIAVRILKGEKASDIPVEVGKSISVFDYSKLDSFNVRESALPPNTVFINKPFSVIGHNPRLFAIIFIVFVFLLLVILFLYLYIYLKRSRFKLESQHNEEMRIANKALEEAKLKAEEASRLKSAFLANVSHEIRTPMNGIVGFASLLSDIENLTTEKRTLYLEMINTNSQLLLNLINDILDLSRIEADKLRIRKKSFDINKLIIELYVFYQSEKERLQKDKLSLNFSIGSSTKTLEIYTDGERLHQVFINLIGNALKFTDKGYVEFGYTIENEIIKFYVKDTGIGIKDEYQRAIFDRFIQADSSSTRSYGGTGLGLAICKAIVEKLNGEIWVESELGKGSAFYFTLPFVSLPASAVSSDSEDVVPASENWSGRSVLIVEDNDLTYNLIAEMLTTTGLKLKRACNGKEAVVLASTGLFDLVLMDMQLPLMDGYEATRRIREKNKNICIIAQTANAMVEDRERALTAGCNDFIPKPFTQKELFDVIAKNFKPVSV